MQPTLLPQVMRWWNPRSKDIPHRQDKSAAGDQPQAFSQTRQTHKRNTLHIKLQRDLPKGRMRRAYAVQEVLWKHPGSWTASACPAQRAAISKRNGYGRLKDLHQGEPIRRPMFSKTGELPETSTLNLRLYICRRFYPCWASYSLYSV